MQVAGFVFQGDFIKSYGLSSLSAVLEQIDDIGGKFDALFGGSALVIWYTDTEI
jgi:hypothetical protein